MKRLSFLFLFSFILFASSTCQSDLAIDSEDSYTYLLTEEKLAHDFYVSSYEMYDKQVFQNILNSEARHFDMMAEVVNRKLDENKIYELGRVGEFEDPEFQKMFDDLLINGKKSLVEALKVGALIEETDITDLEEVLSSEKDEFTADVLKKLVAASENHLRAFVKNLDNAGIDYKPEILDLERFNKIISSKNSCCSGEKNGNNEACCSSGKKSNNANCSGKKGNNKGAKCCSNS